VPQLTDVEIAGAGYMLAPGSYRRMQEGIAEGRPGRVVQKDFFAGSRRAVQLERDRGYDGLGVGPAFQGQGVEPWPGLATFTEASMASLPSASVRASSATANGAVYIGVGRYLYRTPPIAGVAWSQLTQVFDFGVGIVISGLAGYRNHIAIATGDGVPIRRFDTTTLVVTTILAGEYGGDVVSYGGGILYSSRSANGDTFRLGSTIRKFDGTIVTRGWELDSEIVRVALHGGEVVIATRTSLYLFNGVSDPGATGVQPSWSTNPRALFSHGLWVGPQDFTFLQSFGGKLYTWLANGVMEYDGSQAKERWRCMGPEGSSCLGACVSGGFLWVAVTSRAGRSELWGFDGSGWWRVFNDDPATVQHVWPIAVSGAADRDVLCWRAGSLTYDLARAYPRSAALGSYATSGEFISSLFDAGQRDKPKAWRKVGAVFASPEGRGNTASVDSVSIFLDYSLDGGTTWTQAATLSSTAAALRIRELDAELLADQVSRWVQLRVRWSSVLDWAPVLVGVWAEFELFDTPTRRQKWAFKVIAQDGQVQSRTGRQLASDLWAAWRAGATVTYRDLDYDADPTQRSVRIVGISESVDRPADAGSWGDSVLDLVLVEV